MSCSDTKASLLEQEAQPKAQPETQLETRAALAGQTELPLRIGNKRLFVGLICGASLIICLCLILFWGIPYVGFSNIHPSVPYIAGGLLLLTVLGISWSSFGLVLQLLTGRAIMGAGKTRSLTIKLFLPITEILGRLLGIAPLEIRRSFIQINNDMVIKTQKRYDPAEVLILLPHCIQRSDCPIRVNVDLSRCKRCGKCSIGALQDLVEHYGAHIAIATGGTIARRIVVDLRPKMILAVACERDLTSGIQDTYPLPVYGILNERPFGPCRDTRIAPERVEEALQHFIRTNKLPPEGAQKSGSAALLPVK